MENKLTHEEIARVFAMYYGCRCVICLEKGSFSGDLKVSSEVLLNLSMKEGHTDKVNWRLSLRLLSSLTDEEILELCKFVEPEEFGDYRYKSWKIERKKDNLTHYACVTMEGNSFEYKIDLIDGDINLYNGGDQQMCVKTHYKQWYFQNGFAVPLFFGLGHWADGKNAIELNIAIDKTKQG